MTKKIRVLGYGQPLEVGEVDVLIGNLAAFVGIPKPGWDLEPIYDVHGKVVHGSVELGFYEQGDDTLHFNAIKPDINLVAHEMGHLVFHKLYPGVCDGDNPECELFARKFAEDVEHPKGVLGVVEWGPVRKGVRQKLYGF